MCTALDFSQHLCIIALVLVLIASICKLLWITASAKCLNVMNIFKCVNNILELYLKLRSD